MSMTKITETPHDIEEKQEDGKSHWIMSENASYKPSWKMLLQTQRWAKHKNLSAAASLPSRTFCPTLLPVNL